MNYKPRLIVSTFLVGSIVLSLCALLGPTDNTSYPFQWALIMICSCHFCMSNNILTRIVVHKEKRVVAFCISLTTLIVMLVLVVISRSFDTLATAIGIAGAIALYFTLSPTKARQ